jgi:GT2 family glycosyltransferase
MSKPLVYILILNYCSFEDTVACIESVRKINYCNFRILVIDNGSPDGSGALLKKSISENELMLLPKNIGYAGGNNEGISKALQEAADYVFIVNPDVRLSPDSIQMYVDMMEKDKKIGALNPLQLDDDGQTIDKRFFGCVLDESAGSRLITLNNGEKIWDVKTLFGAALMLSRQTLERTGGFDPLYFSYGEEQDLCRRILYHGMRLVVTEREPVVHLRTHERDGIDDIRMFLRLKGKYLLRLKNPYGGFIRLFRVLIRELIKDLREKGSGFVYKKTHIIKAFTWVMWHLNDIRRHRTLERRGRTYI